MIEKYKQYTIPSIIIVVIFTLTLVLLKPILGKTLSLSKENKDNAKMVAKLVEKSEKLKAVDQAEIESKVLAVENVFPSRKPVLNLLASLEQLSLDEQVGFAGIELKPGQIDEKVKSKVQNFDISFSVEGKLNNISSFINKLEKTSPLMRINKMDLNMISESSLSSNLKIVLLVKVFYQLPPDDVGKLDAPFPILTQDEVNIIERISAFKSPPALKPNAPTGKKDFFSSFSNDNQGD